MPASPKFSNLFEDREGTIWVTTNNGLDRFRGFAIATLSVNQGLSNPASGDWLPPLSIKTPLDALIERYGTACHQQCTKQGMNKQQEQEGMRQS